MTKTLKTLEIFNQLLTKESLTKSEMFEIIGSEEERYVRRYIQTINEFIDQSEIDIEPVIYKNEKYQLKYNGSILNTGQVIAISKILIASKGLNEEETKNILNGLTRTLKEDDQQLVVSIIAGDQFHYQSLMMGVPLTDTLYDISNMIMNKQTVQIDYANAINETKTHVVLPQYILFNNNYFYLIGISDKDYQMFLRIDRIQSYKPSDIEVKAEKSDIKYEVLSNGVKYMFNGEKQKVVFEFNGIPEYVFDDFPKVKMLKADFENSCFTFEVETIGDGILMWLLSQGSRVKVKSPVSMVEKYRCEVQLMNSIINE